MGRRLRYPCLQLVVDKSDEVDYKNYLRRRPPMETAVAPAMGWLFKRKPGEGSP